MNDNFYKQLIEESLLGYAYHKIICDENDIPCDYEYIEVNTAFEKYTGLKSLDIVGRKVTEVLPDIKKDKFDWINICGDIAINGGKKEVDRFSKLLKRWYKVNIYSPKKYYFVVYIIDISYEMSQLYEIKRLAEMSEELLQINEQEIDYQKISDDFLALCGAKYAAFNLFDNDGEEFTTIAISGDNGLLRKASNILGFKPENKKWKYDLVRDKKNDSGIITHINSLKELTGRVIPIPVAAMLENILNIGEVVIIKILRENIMIGDFMLFMKKGEQFNKDNLAEVYTRQVGMVIAQKRVEKALLNEKVLTNAIFQSVPGILYLYNYQGKLVRWNKRHEDITGYSEDELYEMNILDWYNFDEKNYSNFRLIINSTLKDGFGAGEVILRKKNGTRVPVYCTVSSLYLDGEQYFAGIAIDISSRKEKEEEILYLSYHDQLTGLYNRRFFEEELKRLDTERNLPLTIIMGDVNGLKLINDTFGHAMGDKLLKKVAEIIKLGCRTDDIITRMGGDEFVIILPKTDALVAEQIIKHITNLSLNEKVDCISISASFGYRTKKNMDEKIGDIFKNAEDNMYKKKLFEKPSMGAKTIKTILNTLHEKNKREEQHSHRVAKLCENMGKALELTEDENEELYLVGLLHDIGKIAIDESILNKPDKLTNDEWEEIKRHSEIGYRILSAVNNMSEIATYVLYHHERWEGKGYPKGLIGNEIPLVSRIITIADSYDAMTSERSYRGSLTKEVAIGELKKNAGSQFDPELVSIFIEKVLGRTS